MLIRFVGLGVLLLRHVAATEKVPALCIGLISIDRFFEVLDCLLLAVEARALLVMQPTKLLQHFGVIWVPIKYSSVRGLCSIIFFLLFVHMADLEPDVLFRQWAGRVRDNISEALKTLRELLLLLVDDAKSEVDLIGFFEIGLHAHDLREGFLGMLEGTVPIIQNADAIPEFRLPGV